jgi:hypothetical protein
MMITIAADIGYIASLYMWGLATVVVMMGLLGSLAIGSVMPFDFEAIQEIFGEEEKAIFLLTSNETGEQQQEGDRELVKMFHETAQRYN